MAIFFFFFWEFLPLTDLLPTQEFCILLLSTQRNFPKQVSGMAIQTRTEDCDAHGWGAWKLRHGKRRDGVGRFHWDTRRQEFRRVPTNAASPTLPLPWRAQHTLLEEHSLIPTPGARCWETGSRGRRGEGNLYSVYQNEENTQAPEPRSQIIAEGMPACQVFLQPWLPWRNTDR